MTMMIKDGKEETVMCTNCYKELGGNDPIFIDNENWPYCSKKCLLTHLFWKKTSAKKFIEEQNNGKSSLED